MPPAPPPGDRLGTGGIGRAAGFAAGLPRGALRRFARTPARAATRRGSCGPTNRPRLLSSPSIFVISRRPVTVEPPFVHRFAPIVDAGRARLLTIGERLQQIGQLGVAMLFHEPRHIAGPAPAARSQTIDGGGGSEGRTGRPRRRGASADNSTEPEQRAEFGVVNVTSDTRTKTCSTAILSILRPARLSL